MPLSNVPDSLRPDDAQQFGDGAATAPPVLATDDETGDALAAPLADLSQRLTDRTATIGIVGLGYVGLPLAVEYARRGFQTVGIDLSAGRVAQLNAGDSYIPDVSPERLAEALEGGFRAEADFASGPDIDVYFICVPTPVTVNKDPDTTYIASASRAVAEHLRPGQLVVLKSTTYPDTTEGLVMPILKEAAGDLVLGEDYALAFSPERVDPGNTEFTTENTPIVVGGVTPACTTVAALAIQQVVNLVHLVSSPKVAEMEKLLENIFRSVNIALANEMALLCDRMGGLSVWEVIEAAATKPFGFMPFTPGPGLGGHCIPIDPYYLSWAARRYDFDASFIALAGRVNEGMPFEVTRSVVGAIADGGTRLGEARVLVLGVAFKRDVNDCRHSPALRVIELLHQRGIGTVDYADPHVPTVRVPLGRGGALDLAAVVPTPEALASYDVVVVTTDHTAFDYDEIATHAPVVVDTRNALRGVAERGNVLLLGGGDRSERAPYAAPPAVTATLLPTTDHS